MTAERTIETARDVLRRVGSENAVVTVQPGGPNDVSDLAQPATMYHDGIVAQAEMDPQSADADAAELRAALLVIACDNGNGAPMSLSNKEVAYLELVCDGLSDAEAADRLGLSLRAIKSRKKSVLASTGSTTLSHAVARFLRYKD